MPLGEAANYIEQESVRSELKTTHSYAKFDNNTMVSVFGRAEDLLVRSDTEAVQYLYCDYLLDYWPDVHQPVGYHLRGWCEEWARRG